MGTRFTRVTVVGDGRQIDISLPANSPLTEQMPAILRLLSVPTSTSGVRWRLAAPELGPIDPSRSLDDVGVLDGAALYLTEAAAAPAPPFVDDVETAIAESVVDSAPTWDGRARRSGVARLLAVVLVGVLLFAFTAPSAVGWCGPIIVLMAGLGVGATVRERGGLLAALTAVPGVPAVLMGVIAAKPGVLGGSVSRSAGGSGGGDVIDPPASPTRPIEALAFVFTWHGFALVLVAAGALGLVAAGLVRRIPGLITGGLAATLSTVAALVATRAGLPADRIAGLGLIVAVVLTGLAGQVALGGAGLVDLMVADEQGRPVPRARVVASVRRGLSLAGGLVWAAVVLGAASCWILIAAVPEDGTAAWIAPALGALGGVIFGLRSRMFSRAAHVGPMLAVAVSTATACAFPVRTWFGWTPGAGSASVLGGLAVVGALIGIGGFRTLREVSRARLQRGFERLEVLAVLALVPGLVLLFRVIPAVQRWWT